MKREGRHGFGVMTRDRLRVTGKKLPGLKVKLHKDNKELAETGVKKRNTHVKKKPTSS